jgi:hypothetical protein
MMLQSYNPSSRYKNRAAQRLSNAISMLVVIALSACVGFWMGKQFSVEESISLREQTKQLTAERLTLQQNLTELRAEAQTANTRYEQIKAEYNAVMPEGPMQDITSLVRQQLEQGMAPERLFFVIKSARPPTDCSEPTPNALLFPHQTIQVRSVRSRWLMAPLLLAVRAFLQPTEMEKRKRGLTQVSQ